MTKYWPAKDPDEILRYSYDWSPDLAPGEVLDAIVLIEPTVAAGTTLEAQQFDDQFVTLIISGGTDGEEAAYLIRVHSSLDNTFEDTVVLPIAAKVAPEPHEGGYAVPTAANLIALFPEFQLVAGDTIDYYLARAGRVVTDSWPEGDYAHAYMLLAAHYLTLSGFGTSAEATAIRNGSGQFRSMRIGSLALERFGGSGAISSKVNELGSTRYGRELLPMVRAMRWGARVTGGVALGIGDGDNFGPWTGP